jgi:hypothetical protein
MTNRYLGANAIPDAIRTAPALATPVPQPAELPGFFSLSGLQLVLEQETGQRAPSHRSLYRQVRARRSLRCSTVGNIGSAARTCRPSSRRWD